MWGWFFSFSARDLFKYLLKNSMKDVVVETHRERDSEKETDRERERFREVNGERERERDCSEGNRKRKRDFQCESWFAFKVS